MKQAAVKRPYGGFSSLIFIMIVGSGLFCAPFYDSENPLLSVIISFAISLVMVYLYGLLGRYRESIFIKLVTVAAAVVSLPWQYVRVNEYLAFIGKTASIYQRKDFLFFSIIIIYAVGVYCFCRGEKAAKRASMLALPIPVAILLFMLPAPFVGGAKITSGVGFTQITDFAALIANSVKSSFVLAGDIIAVYLISGKNSFYDTESRKKAFPGFCGLVFAYAYILIVTAITEAFVGTFVDTTVNPAMRLLDSAYEVKYGSLCIVYFTATLLFRISVYVLLLGKAFEIIINFVKSLKATFFSTR